MIKIFIGGDICPTPRDIDSFIDGDAASLFGGVGERIKSADYAIANMECPLIERETPILKSGAVFGSPPEILNAINAVGINFLNLANNHALDHGETGLDSTMRALKSYGIDYSGAGVNEEEASLPFVKEIKGKKIGIISYCEHEFSVATQGSAGANGLDLFEFPRTIKNIKSECDFILLLYHGGKENYSLPSPKQQKLCRHFVDMGVNMVVCQHSHCAGVIEEYEGGQIFYGQGNFVFDPFPLKKQHLYQGFSIELSFDESGDYRYELIPTEHNSLEGGGPGIDLCPEGQGAGFIRNILAESALVKSDDAYVSRQWQRLAADNKYLYLAVVSGYGRILRKLNERFGFTRLFFKDARLRTAKNIVTCETHLELLQTVLKDD